MPAVPPALGTGSPDELPGVTPDASAEIALDQDPGSQTLVAADGSRTPVDVVFPVMHGPLRRGRLDPGVPRDGRSAVRRRRRARLGGRAGQGDPEGACSPRPASRSCRYEVVHERDWEEDPEGVEARAVHLGYPLFAKPSALGSSVGIEVVEDASRLRGALEEAFRFGRKAVLERSVARASGDRVSRCSATTTPSPRWRARSSRGTTSSTTTRPSTWTSTAPSS